MVNVLLLNALLLIGAALVITLPASVNAAFVAIHRWRQDGEDRVFREFTSALRSRPLGHTTLVNGVPMVSVAVGLEEVHYFVLKTGLMAHLCFGLGCGALLVSMSALGYVFVLGALAPSTPASELWSTAARLAVRNLLLTGPLFIAEIGAAVTLGLLDPALCLIGLPVLLLHAMYHTARWGLQRADNVGLSCANIET